MSTITETQKSIMDDIFEGDEMVYMLHGDVDVANQLVTDFNETMENVSELPLSFVMKSEDNIEDITRENNYFDTITLRLLLSRYFVIRVDNLDDLDGGKIKDLVHGDTFYLADMLLDRDNFRNYKLLIVTSADPNNSMFSNDAGLRARSKFIHLC